jgi:hypothetical protein
VYLKTLDEQLAEIEKDASECIGNEYWTDQVSRLTAALKLAIEQRNALQLEQPEAKKWCIEVMNKELQAILAGER